jgi:hypothetical protein
MTSKLSLEDLLSESESALWAASSWPDRHRARIALRVTNDFRVFDKWRTRHTHLLRPTARATARFGQPERLRALGVKLIERCALFDYLRQHHVTGVERDAFVALVRHSDNPRRALLDLHEDYVLSESSTICVEHLLDCLSDRSGRRLLSRYRAAYLASYSSMCADLSGLNDWSASDERHLQLKPEVASLRSILAPTLN